ncbi:ABC transporter substrate-binding protein [Myceligenerans crystallogenes]|uniref:ABC transporter substrate-binding protein n=1 Tax=Myceligenerans crystallogenes TaxID=316335 RepID=A0ABN2N8Y3_9MICO
MPDHIIRPVAGRRTARPPRPRALLAAAAAALALLASGCAASAGGAEVTGGLAEDAPLPTEVPAGTRLVVGDQLIQKAFELAGDDIDQDFDFELEWANISGGPQTLEAFNANALDLGSVAEIPALHATWTGLDVRIYATHYREDWDENPIYELASAPGVALDSLADLRGKKIAFSPGQAQGALVLKSLREAGLTQDDVELVELPSTGDVYPTALAAGELDVAPLGSTPLYRYLAQYGKDGATSIRTGIRDDAGHLYGPAAVVRDPAKAAALRQFVRAWAQARVWIDEHPQEWKQGYYIEDQGLSEQDAQYAIDTWPVTEIPAEDDLPGVVGRHQETADLLRAELHDTLSRQEIDVAGLFDERFVPIASEAAEAAREES